MLTLIILISLGLGFYFGYRRGLVMQSIRLLGYVVTFILATQFFQPLSQWVEMIVPFPAVAQNTNLAIYNEQTSFIIDDAFYRVLTFILIGFIGWLVTNLLARLFQPLLYIGILNTANKVIGGIINFLVTYVIIFILLFALSLIPLEFIQQQFVNSPLAYWIVTQSPLLSSFAADAWLAINPRSN